jgi:plastocyanin
MNNGQLLLAVSTLAILSIITINVYAEEVKISKDSSIVNCTDFSNNCYNPAVLTIPKGTTVTWTNDDTTTHTVTSGISFGLSKVEEFKGKQFGPDGLFDSGLIAPGATFSFKFDNEGEYLYYCSLHPLMVGKVIVQAEEKKEEGNIMRGVKFDLSTDLPLPYDKDLNDKITLKVIPKETNKHLDYKIIISRDGKEVFNKNFHDHDGILELMIMKGEGDIKVEGGEEKDNETTQYMITGPIFTENGQYTINVSITGIEFKPIEPISEEFSINVVPEFPLAAIIPLILGVSAVILINKRIINL